MDWDELVIVNAEGKLVIYDDVEHLRDLIHQFDTAPLKTSSILMNEEDFKDILQWSGPHSTT